MRNRPALNQPRPPPSTMRGPNKLLAISAMSVLSALTTVPSAAISTESKIVEDHDESNEEPSLSRMMNMKGSDGSARFLFDSSFNDIHEISGGLDGSHMDKMFSPRGSNLKTRRRRRRLVGRHLEGIQLDAFKREIEDRFDDNQLKEVSSVFPQ